MEERLHTQEEWLDIQTPRLHVRHLTLSDLVDFHLYRSNPDVTKYQGFYVMKP
jgi:ribosomal-protein-alanine N-acetyltransferase